MTEKRLFLVGERWGPEEARERAAFVGGSGYVLTQMLIEAGIHRADCYLTNVINFRPPNDMMEAICGARSEGVAGYPAIIPSRYLRAEFQSEIDRLADEVEIGRASCRERR